MDKNVTILFVDDEENILSALKRLMRRTPYNCLFANGGHEALKMLEENAVSIVISDMKMPEMTGEELLAEVAKLYPETMRLVLSGYSEENMIMSAINEGRIWGFIHKPWNDAELKQVIDHAVFTQEVIAERALLRLTVAKYKASHKDSFADFIGDSVPMQLVYSNIEKAAPSKASVFVTGESGTGKELVARAVHEYSKRSDGPFIALNCAAIPSELMESEIFGHVKGAFSGALNHRDGAATLANGGTLFLDELAEMDINLQSKLLRFIQTGTFQKVGSGKTEKVDIRFVCATNKEPLKAVEDKLLREDLYYRLNVVQITLPPLRDRDEDSLTLAKAFLSRFSESEEKVIVGFSSDAEKVILSYDWPGNVRQLENSIHSAVIMANGPLITDQDLANVLSLRLTDLIDKPDSHQATESNQAHEERRKPIPDSVSAPEEIQSLAKIEEMAIKKALDHCEGNVVRAAGLLQVSPSTLYRKIQSWEPDGSS